MSERVGSRRVRVLLVLAVLLVAGGYVGYRFVVHTVRRYAVVMIYGNAVYWYGEEHGHPLPATIAELEDFYANSPNKSALLPPVPDWPEPIYRPTSRSEGGPYVVLVERPAHWYDFGRFVWYDPMEEAEECRSWVWESELDELLAEDDRRRVAGESVGGEESARVIEIDVLIGERVEKCRFDGEVCDCEEAVERCRKALEAGGVSKVVVDEEDKRVQEGGMELVETLREMASRYGVVFEVVGAMSDRMDVGGG